MNFERRSSQLTFALAFMLTSRQTPDPLAVGAYMQRLRLSGPSAPGEDSSRPQGIYDMR